MANVLKYGLAASLVSIAAAGIWLTIWGGSPPNKPELLKEATTEVTNELVQVSSEIERMVNWGVSKGGVVVDTKVTRQLGVPSDGNNSVGNSYVGVRVQVHPSRPILQSAVIKKNALCLERGKPVSIRRYDSIPGPDLKIVTLAECLVDKN